MDLARSIAAASRRWRSSWPFPWRAATDAKQADPRHTLGRRGEHLAARYLRGRHGFKILYRNFRARRGGEVDIVCRDADTLVFVEVKTRASLEFGRPAQAVNADKQALIARGALGWLRQLDHPDIVFRFDIVEVLVEAGRRPRCRLVKNAFTLPKPWIY